MKGKKQGIVAGGILLLALLAAMMMSGCLVSVGPVTYKDAEKYTAGGFSYKAAEVEEVVVNWISGSVKVIQKTDASLSVSETDKGLKDSQKLHWYLDGKVLRIEFCENGYRGDFPKNTKDLTLELPSDIRLELNSVSGDVSMADPQKYSDLRINTVSGATKADDLKADNLQINTVSGDVRIAGLSSPKVKINSVSGNQFLGLADCEEVDAESVSGNITFTTLPAGGATIEYESTNGKLKGDDYKKSGENYIFGDGACRIEVDTVSGNLTIN